MSIESQLAHIKNTISNIEHQLNTVKHLVHSLELNIVEKKQEEEQKKKEKDEREKKKSIERKYEEKKCQHRVFTFTITLFQSWYRGTEWIDKEAIVIKQRRER